MWRVNYLLQSFFTLMIHIVEDFHIFYNCIESTLPDFLRHDHHESDDSDEDSWEYYDTANDLYLLQRGHDDSEDIENDTRTKF